MDDFEDDFEDGIEDDYDVDGLDLGGSINSPFRGESLRGRAKDAKEPTETTRGKSAKDAKEPTETTKGKSAKNAKEPTETTKGKSTKNASEPVGNSSSTASGNSFKNRQRSKNGLDSKDNKSKGNSSKNKDSKNKSRQKKGNNAGKGLIGNIKGAVQGNKIDLVLLIMKGVVLVIVLVLVFIALIMEGDSKDTSEVATDSVAGIIDENASEENKAFFANTGSLIMATDSELEKMNESIMEIVANTHQNIYDELNIEYSDKKPNTVANRIQHITTNLANEETADVEKVEHKSNYPSGLASVTQKRTILEHILRAEKYNFNNIIWRSYVKDESNNIKETDMKFQIDTAANLRYPVGDAGDTDMVEHDLMFFVNKTRAYLQSWYIPYDLLIGTKDTVSEVSEENINTKYAYEILASAYHEIVVDRYKVETLTRNTKYRVYDLITTTKKVTRTCADYEVNGETLTYCSDKTTEEVETTKDVRENVKTSDSTSYRWDYVVSTAKMFDSVISHKYRFTAYSKYSNDNYKKYINKDQGYSEITVDQFTESEIENGKADSYSHNDKDYYDQKSKKTNTPWKSANVGEPPAGAKKIGTETSKVVSTEVIEEKKGKEYTDIYVWNDSLELEEYKTGIYNVDSVKDVTGDDLSASDFDYYNSLYYNQEINLVDLMNSDKDIYSNYLSSHEMKENTDNIGISKLGQSLEYDVLKDDLAQMLETYPLNSIKYGQSLGLDTSSFNILNGVSFGAVENIAAGSMEGQNVAYPISTEDLSNSRLQVKSKYGNSYGYEGHTGVDISYNYSAADKSLCNDYTNSVCPYMKGPEIYTMMDGVIKEVGYSSYNKYYKAGKYSGNSTQGNLKINDTSGWGTYVKIQNTDGSYTIYSHLFPDKEFYKQMSEMIDKPISAGTFIGYMGNTGNSSGLHLHVEFAKSLKGFASSTANSSNTYIYLMKIIDAMKIKPPKS